MSELKNLRVFNFRNIEALEIKVNSPLLCLWGDNAQGKTNILEALYLTSNTKSFRSGNPSDWIRKGEKTALVSVDIDDRCGPCTLSYSVDKNGRQFFMGKNRLSGIKEVISRLRLISYSPNSHEIILGDDGERRRFLDRLIYSIHPIHLDNLVRYNKALKNRNMAIKQNADYRIWDTLIAEYGSKISHKRNEAVRDVKDYFRETFNSFFDDKKDLNISYVPSGSLDSSELLKKLAKTSKSDEEQGMTTVGPHRDKIDIMLDFMDARKTVSTGQAKLMAFIFKILKLSFIRRFGHEKPIFLYDDVNAFLDEKRLLQLIEIIKKENVQIIATAVDNSLFKNLFSDSVQFITVSKGSVVDGC